MKKNKKNKHARRGKKTKNLKGVFVTDKRGVKKFVMMNAMIFAF